MTVDLNIGPDLPPKTDYGIGCVGAGFIMKDIHLVAYAEAGFDVYVTTAVDRDVKLVTADARLRRFAAGVCLW